MQYPHEPPQDFVAVMQRDKKILDDKIKDVHGKRAVDYNIAVPSSLEYMKNDGTSNS